MMNYLQKIGRSLMLPIAVLPAAAILMGIGHWITSVSGDVAIANILFKGGAALIDNMAILFAVSIAYGMSKDKNGAACITGLVGWLVVTNMLKPSTLALFTGASVESINPAFSKIETQFIGILIGIIAAAIYNATYEVELPTALSFFSGRRLSAIVSAVVALLLSGVLYFVWPILYTGLVKFGEGILSLDAAGAGIFGFLNRLLIPFGLHHALNSVFWFDVANINDMGNFLGGTGVVGETGRYLAGFFPIMMFGLPAAALAMYKEALPSQKAKVGGIFLAAAVASFFTGITEPLEFAFMFVAPILFVIHAVLTGISMFLAATFQWISGFSFSAGLSDFALQFKNPMAVNSIMLLVLGLGMGVVYYFVFRFCIRKFNLKTPGRVEEVEETNEDDTEGKSKHTILAEKVVEILGKDNIVSVDNCATRLRLVISENLEVDKDKLKQAGFAGIMQSGKTNLQIVVGPTVEFVADELKKLV